MLPLLQQRVPTLRVELSHSEIASWECRFAIFDQFPGTEHIECGAFLQWRPGAAEQTGAGTDGPPMRPGLAAATSGAAAAEQPVRAGGAAEEAGAAGEAALTAESDSQ